MADPQITPIPSRVKDLTGKTYGRLTAISFAGQIPGANGVRYASFLCRCECGKQITVRGSSLTAGHTKSCGCYGAEVHAKNLQNRPARQPAETHGKSRTPENVVWLGIKQRCFNPKNHAYARYGGRGITMCDRWKESFPAFLEDMGPRPTGTSIERDDVNGNYEPGNCRWATAKEQGQNTRRNRFIEVEGKRMTISQAADLKGIPYKLLASRVAAGLPEANWFLPRYGPRSK